MTAGTGSSAYNRIPTNFPTRTLKLVVYNTSGVHVVSIPSTFAPDTSKRIVVLQYVSGGPCTNYMRVGSALVHSTTIASGWSAVCYELDWDPVAATWTSKSDSIAARPYTFAAGERYDPVPPAAPSTVDEWLAKYVQE
jgi:hypothetical protein